MQTSSNFHFWNVGKSLPVMGRKCPGPRASMSKFLGFLWTSKKSINPWLHLGIHPLPVIKKGDLEFSNMFFIIIWLGHANQDFYHFKPGLQHLSSRRKDFICQLTQCQLSSSIIRTSIKEHLQPIKTQSNDRKPQTTNQIPAQPCAAKEAMGKRARQLSGSSYLVIMYFNFHRLIWNSFGILVPPLATISICMPTSFEATLLPTIPLLHPLIKLWRLHRWIQLQPQRYHRWWGGFSAVWRSAFGHDIGQAGADPWYWKHWSFFFEQMDAPISHKPSKFRGFPFFNLPCKNTPSTTSTFLLTSLPNIWGMRGIAHETCSWLRTNLATWTVAGRWNWSGWQDCAEQKLPWHSTEVHKLGFCFLVEPLSPIKPYKGYIRGSMQNVSFVDWGVIQKVQKQWVKNHRMAHLLRSVLTISCLPQSATPLWPSRPKSSGALFANWRSRPEVNSSAMTRAAVPTEGSGALARLARCAQHCSTSHKQPREGVIQSMCCLCRARRSVTSFRSSAQNPFYHPPHHPLYHHPLILKFNMLFFYDSLRPQGTI